MMNKINLIDIKEDPIGLIKKIIDNKDKYTYLIEKMLTEVMHRYFNVGFEIIYHIEYIDKDFNPFLRIDFNNQSMSDFYPDFLKYKNMKVEPNSTRIHEDNMVNNEEALAYEAILLSKFNIDVSEIFDLDDEYMGKLPTGKIEELQAIRSLKWLYAIIVLFGRSTTVTKLLSKENYHNGIRIVELNDENVLKADVVYEKSIAVNLFKTEMLYSKLIDFDYIWKTEYNIKRWVTSIGENHIVIKDLSNVNARYVIKLEDFDYNKLFIMPLTDSFEDKGIIFIDMEYLSKVVASTFIANVEKYKRSDKEFVIAPVSKTRLRIQIENLINDGYFTSKYVPVIWSLLSWKFEFNLDHDKWRNAIIAYPHEFVYKHRFKDRVFIKNISDYLLDESDTTFVYDYIEKMNHNVIMAEEGLSDFTYFNLFIGDLLMDVLDLHLKDEVEPMLVAVNEETKSEFLCRLNVMPDVYIANVINFEGNWDFIYKNNKDVLKTFIELASGLKRKRSGNYDDEYIPTCIENTIRNLFEKNTRKTLFKVLVSACKYITSVFDFMGATATLTDYENVVKTVNKIEFEDGKIKFWNKDMKNANRKSYEAVNKDVSKVAIKVKGQYLQYIRVNNMGGRYSGWGTGYKIVKDILWTYFCLIITDDYRVFTREELLPGLSVNDLPIRFSGNTIYKVKTVEEEIISNDSGCAMRFIPMSEGNSYIRDQEIESIGIDPNKVPFMIRYKEELISDDLSEYRDKSKYNVLPLPDYKNASKEMDQLLEVSSDIKEEVEKWPCIKYPPTMILKNLETHEITHEENYTVSTPEVSNIDKLKLEQAFSSIRSLLGRNNDKLEDMWNKQSEFDDLTFKRNNVNRDSTRIHRYTALMVELGEILKEDECFKYWKSSKHTIEDTQYKERAKEEFVDMLHLVMSIGIDLFKDHNELYEYFIKKHYINIERQKDNY